MDAQIKQVVAIFNEIATNSSKSIKENIIARNAENQLFKRILKFVFDDFIRTGISTKKIEKALDLPVVNDFSSLEEAMDFVEKNNTGKDQTVADLQHFIGKFSDPMEKETLSAIFSKTLKVGITSTTINKALGKGFIFTFGCQLAHPYEKYADKLKGKEFVLTQKLDGHRCIVFIEGDNAAFFTRKGIEMAGLDTLAKHAVLLAKEFDTDMPVVLDGELLLEVDGTIDVGDLFRSTSKAIRDEKADKSGLRFNMFDWLPLPEFLRGNSDLDYGQRRHGMELAYGNYAESLSIRVSNSGGDPKSKTYSPRIKLVKSLYRGEDLEMITELQRKVDEEGWEGLMLNLVDGFYLTKRTSSLLKIKKFFNADILVKDVYEGTGENKGRLGGVVAQFKDFEVQVGSGFSKEERVNFWNDPSLIIGKIIDVQYFEESSNQKGGKGLRFPTYKSLRSDKTAADINYES